MADSHAARVVVGLTPGALAPIQPLKACFRNFKEADNFDFLSTIDPIEQEGGILDVMDMAKSTYQSAEDEKRWGKFKDDPLDVEGIACLMKYSAQDSDPAFFQAMNSRCYEKNRKLIQPFLKYMWLFLKTLRLLDPFPHDIPVFRGVKLNLSTDYPKDREFTWYGFSSLTKSIEVLEDDEFCGKSGDRTIFSIQLTQGQAREITRYSFFDEEEVLMPPGCRFKVKSVMVAGHGLFIISIEELPSREWIIDLSKAEESKVELQGEMERLRNAAQKSEEMAKIIAEKEAEVAAEREKSRSLQAQLEEQCRLEEQRRKEQEQHHAEKQQTREEAERAERAKDEAAESKGELGEGQISQSSTSLSHQSSSDEGFTKKEEAPPVAPPKGSTSGYPTKAAVPPVAPPKAKDPDASLLRPSLKGNEALKAKTRDAGEIRPVQEWQESESAVTCLCFARERLHREYILLAFGNKAGEVIIYRLYRNEMEAAMIQDQDFTPCLKSLPADHSNVAMHARFIGHGRPITSINFNQLEDRLLTTSVDKSSRLWNVDTAEMLKVFTDSSPIMVGIFLPFSPQVFACANANTVIRLVNVSDGNIVQQLKCGSEVGALKFDDLDLAMFVGTKNGSIHVLEAVDSKFLKFKFKVQIARGDVSCITFVPAAHGQPPCLLVNSRDSTATILDCTYESGVLTNLTVRHRVRVAHSLLPVKSCYSPSGQGYLVSGSEDKKVQTCSIARDSDYRLHTLEHHKVPVVAVAVNLQDTLLASADSLGHIVLWRRMDFSDSCD